MQAQRRTPRKSVAYTRNSSYDTYIIQNNKARENLLLLRIFKHEISRKKIKGKKKIICTRKLSNVRKIISRFESFGVCANSERILIKRRQFVVFRAACYSIKQRSNLLLFCCCKKKQTIQCNGFTSKHSNSFFIVFIV